MKQIIITILIIYILYKLYNLLYIKEGMKIYNEIPKGYNYSFKPDDFSYVLKDPHKDITTPKYYKELMEVKNDVLSKMLSIISKNKSHLKYKNFKEIKKNSYNYWTGFYKNKEKSYYSDCKKLVLTEINKFIIKVDNSKFGKKFKIIQDKLHKFLKYKNYQGYLFNIVIFRNKKAYGFSIQCFVIKNLNTNKLFINNLKLIGIIINKNINIKSFNFFENLTYTNYDNGFYKNNFEKLKYSDYKLNSTKNIDLKEGFSNKNIDKHLLKNKSTESLKKNTKLNFIKYCYNKKGFIIPFNNKILCESKYDFFNKKKEKKNIGIWDKPCDKNNECPFYKANKNYKNNFGGCINNKCEFPLNMKLYGYRNYRKESKFKPFCYNCLNKKGINSCCDNQKDKKKYPKLLSPDYAFNKDQLIRKQHLKELTKRGLKI